MTKDTQFYTAVAKTQDNHTAKYSVAGVYTPITKKFLSSEIIRYIESYSCGNEQYFNDCRTGHGTGTFMSLIQMMGNHANQYLKFSKTRKAILEQIKLAKAIIETPEYGSPQHNAKLYISESTTNSYIDGLETALEELDTKAQLHYLARWSVMQFVKDNPKIIGENNETFYTQYVPSCVTLK
jgi:hypothetical protein